MDQVYSDYNLISLSSLWKPELVTYEEILKFGGWEPTLSKWNSQTPNFHSDNSVVGDLIDCNGICGGDGVKCDYNDPACGYTESACGDDRGLVLW